MKENRAGHIVSGDKAAGSQLSFRLLEGHSLIWTDKKELRQIIRYGLIKLSCEVTVHRSFFFVF